MAVQLPPGCVLLTGEDAYLLQQLVDRTVHLMLLRDGVVPARAAQIVRVLHQASDEFRASVLVEAGSGTRDDEVGSVAGVSAVTEWLTVAEVARASGVSKSFVRRSAREGALQGARSGPGGAWRFTQGEAALWLADRNRQRRTAA